jgi:hypothetical protein
MGDFKEKGAFWRQLFAEYSQVVRDKFEEYSESIYVGGKKPWA